MTITTSGPAGELRRLRDTADDAAGDVVVITVASGVAAAAVTSSGSRVLALHGTDGRPREARLLALAFFGDSEFAAGDSDSDAFAVYSSGRPAAGR